MLDPLVTLQEAGFSLKPTRGVDRLGGWSPELVASLDWARLSDLAQALVKESGCELAGSRVLPDGSVFFGMIEQPKTARPQRAMVKIAPWNEWGATPETVRMFAQQVQTAKNTRGVLIAPAGFSPAALRAAQELRIEAVDAVTLAAAFQALPKERGESLFAVHIDGDFSTPSCPFCGRKLVRVEHEALELASRIIDTNGLIADPVVCDRLDIVANCEVTFLSEVRARSITISGQASGDFVCEGPVTLEPQGMLSGTVAARSLVVRDGGCLLGQFRILEGDLGSFVKPAVRWHWGCVSAAEREDCAGVVFEPHS